MNHIKELAKRLDLLLLPHEMDLLKLNTRYNIAAIYERLFTLGKIPEWISLTAFRMCCKEYETQELGFKVEGDFIMRVPKKAREHPANKFANQ